MTKKKLEYSLIMIILFIILRIYRYWVLQLILHTHGFWIYNQFNLIMIVLFMSNKEKKQKTKN